MDFSIKMKLIFYYYFLNDLVKTVVDRKINSFSFLTIQWILQKLLFRCPFHLIIQFTHPLIKKLFISDYSRWARGGQQDPQTSCQANARLQDQIPSAFSRTEVQGITFQGQQTKHILSVNCCFFLASKITKIKTPLWWYSNRLP